MNLICSQTVKNNIKNKIYASMKDMVYGDVPAFETVIDAGIIHLFLTENDFQIFQERGSELGIDLSLAEHDM